MTIFLKYWVFNLFISQLLIKTFPTFGLITLVIKSAIVVLPLPGKPIIPNFSPFLISNSILSNTTLSVTP